MMLGRLFLSLATIGIFHAAYSTYEHLSYLKALERPEGPIPQEIVLETLFSLLLGILGACLNTPAFKEITWSSEMRRHKIDEMDSRLGFGSYANRGKQMVSHTSLKKAQEHQGIIS